MNIFGLKTKDILGMNGRNFSYLKPYNFKRARKLADDKLMTKKVLEAADIPVPETYAIISTRQELYDFDFESLPSSFVVKPNNGLGGEGIKVIFGRKRNGSWVASGQQDVTVENLTFHINEIVDGFFSLSHTQDIAFFEERIKIHPDLKLYSYKGIPDIRIIVFNSIPVMAMLRLPTKESGGKANLHLGGVGVGLDISNGITTHAVVKDRFFGDKAIDFLPGTRIPLRGIQVPYWQDILNISVQAANASGLGFAGVDIAIDKEKGPVVLEVNARPGLSIQNANNATLGDRLRRVQGLKVATPKKGIKIAKELFGGEVRQELEEISGKTILGIIEQVALKLPDNTEETVKVKVDTGAFSTSIDFTLAEKLGFSNVIKFAKKLGAFKVGERSAIEERYEEIQESLKMHSDVVETHIVHNSNGSSIRVGVQIEFKLHKKTVRVNANIMDRSAMNYPMLLGRRDLKSFLIDPTK